MTTDNTAALRSGIDASTFDADVRPQDDLFGHVNGRWLDEAEIPAQYYQTTKRLDKVEVLRMLKAGYAVPGCELTQGSHLRIR